MKKVCKVLVLIMMVFGLFVISNAVAENTVEIFETIPPEGTYTVIETIELTGQEVADDPELIELKNRVGLMGANAVVLYEKQFEGRSLIVADQKTAFVGVVIKLTESR